MSAMSGLLSILGILLIMGVGLVCYPFRKKLKAILVLVPLSIMLISLAYLQWGGGLEWYNYLRQEKNKKQVQAVLASIKNPEELVSKLKQRLQQDPTSAEGWYLLGRLYASQNRWQEAQAAFLKAKQLKPEDERIQINYIQSLWQLNNRQFNDTIRQAFQNILVKNPNQPDALAMLAMDAYIRHDNDNAMMYWQQLLTLVPPDSADAKAIRKAIAKIQN